jgi:hypothetical protein
MFFYNIQVYFNEIMYVYSLVYYLGQDYIKSNIIVVHDIVNAERLATE